MLIDGIDGLDGRECPVAVIGSGPVGLALATTLAARGIPVLVLESGGITAQDSIQQLSDAERVEPARHDDMMIAIARRLGGTSNLWGARCVPYDPIDFDARPGVEAKWPIDYATVARFWPEAVAATCSGDPLFVADDRLQPQADDAFSPDLLERWANVQAAQNIHKEAIAGSPTLEVRTYATAVDFSFDDAGRVSAIVVADSRSGARATLRPRVTVLAGGGVESARLLLNARRTSGDRFGGADGPLGRTYMGHVIGEIADIVFDKPEVARAFDFHVNHGSYVRRRFQPSVATQREQGLLNSVFWPVVPPVSDPRHRNAILSMVYLAMSYPAIGGMVTAEAIRRRHVPDPPTPRLPHLRNIVTGLPSAASFGMRFLRDRYMRPERLPGFFVLNRAHRYRLSYHGEHAPNRESRVWLNGNQDRLGLNAVTIDLRFSGNDAQSLVRTHDLLDGWLTRNGIGRLEYEMPLAEREAAILGQAAHGTHQIGLVRMAGNRREGVVDGDLRTFDASNLYVVGAAVLPTSSQANPTLTAVALAIRLAGHLAGELNVGASSIAEPERVMP